MATWVSYPAFKRRVDCHLLDGADVECSCHVPEVEHRLCKCSIAALVKLQKPVQNHVFDEDKSTTWPRVFVKFKLEASRDLVSRAVAFGYRSVSITIGAQARLTAYGRECEYFS